MRCGVVLLIQTIILLATFTMLCQGLLELEKQEKNLGMVFRSQKQEKEHDQEHDQDQEQIQNQDQEEDDILAEYEVKQIFVVKRRRSKSSLDYISQL